MGPIHHTSISIHAHTHSPVTETVIPKNMSEESEVHVVMLPWLAFGHMIPFLDLSIALAKLGIHVSFISTPRNIQRLHKVPRNLSPFIDFVPIPLPNLDSNPLPENAEATTDIPAERMDDLKIACDLLQEPVKSFIAKKSPDFIVVDFFHHWAVEISQELNIPFIFFSISTASTMVFFWTPEFLSGDDRKQARLFPADMMAPPDWVDFPSQVYCKNHEAVAMHNLLFKLGASGIEDGARLTRLVEGSHAVALRSSVELEGDYLELYSKITGKPVFPVGCLPPEKVQEKAITKEEPWNGIFNWLDKQEDSSVVFVGFGSEYKLRREEIHEIAYGIELSGLPFLFSLRKPDWAGEAEEEILPPGFEGRVEGRGVVQVGWAPQREILAHPSIGGSLFHSGWASVVEAMMYGHSLILLPFIIAQPLDSRLLVEKRLAVEVERGEDGSFTRNGITYALQKAMVSEEGEMIRARTKEAAKAIFANQELNNDYIKKFAEYLKNGMKEKN